MYGLGLEVIRIKCSKTPIYRCSQSESYSAGGGVGKL